MLQAFMFQSLFYWISLCDQSHTSFFEGDGACFNPCFIGLASATFGLFKEDKMMMSFNPCFIGLASATK